jgi:hypothetical protein
VLLDAYAVSTREWHFVFLESLTVSALSIREWHRVLLSSDALSVQWHFVLLRFFVSVQQRQLLVLLGYSSLLLPAALHIVSLPHDDTLSQKATVKA